MSLEGLFLEEDEDDRSSEEMEETEIGIMPS